MDYVLGDQMPKGCITVGSEAWRVAKIDPTVMQYGMEFGKQ